MRLTTRFAAVALCGAVLLGTPAAAFAQDAARPVAQLRDDRIATVKARAQEAIQRRITAIDAALTRLAKDPSLTDEHERTLTADLQAVKDGLTTLSGQIAAETDPTRLRELVGDIVDQFYVFRFQLPRVRLVIAADRALAVATRLDGIADRLQTAIDKAKAAGHDVGTAEESLRDMRQHVTTGRNRARAAGDKVIALNVSGFPGNATVLSDARRDLAAARQDFATARHDAAQVVAALKAAR